MQQGSRKEYGICDERDCALVEVRVRRRHVVRLRVPGIVLHLLGALVVALVLLQLHKPGSMSEATSVRATLHQKIMLYTVQTAVATDRTNRQGGGVVLTSWLPLVVLCVHCTQIEVR